MEPTGILGPAARRIATIAALASLLATGCMEPVATPRSRVYGGSFSYAPRPALPTGPTTKTVAPVATTLPTAPSPKIVSAPRRTGNGGLDDIVARIRNRDAERAREAEARKSRERDIWLAAHESDLGGVRSRLNAMRLFASTEADPGARDGAKEAIARTEAELDGLRDRVGAGAIGFSDASRIRTALQNRHEALLSRHPSYRNAMGGKTTQPRTTP